MTRNKAMKHLGYALENRDFWREAYVENERDTKSMLDVRGLFGSNGTLREERRAECIREIKEANERIARFERIVK